MNRYFGTHSLDGEWHALLPRYQLLAERVRGSRVLDIGCGSGIGASLLLELGAESVYGVDHRPEVVELARIKHDKPGLHFHVMFWESLEFGDNHFDMVLCLDPASPVTDRNLLAEVRRVLCPGGEYICAVERGRPAGLQALLPRYGYASPSNQVSINQPALRAPQIGELSAYFDTIINVVQRPRLSYVFEPPTVGAHHLDASLATAREPYHVRESRHLPDQAHGGLWRVQLEETSAPQLDEPGQWIPVDHSLAQGDLDTAGVEIFFCGDAHLPPPPLCEVRIPYHHLVERLTGVLEELQARQTLGGEPSSFDEVIDAPLPAHAADPLEDTRETGEFGDPDPWDRVPTGVHALPTDAPPVLDELRAHGAPMDDFYAQYQQLRQQFDVLDQLTRQALAERDAQINNLAQQLAGAQAAPAPDAQQWAQETTSVFKVAALAAGPTGQTPIRDDLAQDSGADAPRRDALADDIAALTQQRARIDAMLAEHQSQLDTLTADQDQPATAPAQPDANPSEAPAVDDAPKPDADLDIDGDADSQANADDPAPTDAQPDPKQADADMDTPPETHEASDENESDATK